MTEIYWLQRLGNIAFGFNLGFCFCIAIAFAIVIWCTLDFVFEGKDSQVSKIFGDNRFTHWLKKFAMVFAFFAIGSLIVPTQNDLLMIYGLGGTIDYIKSNDKAKELPDKVVDALTRYVDHIEKENGGENNNTNQ